MPATARIVDLDRKLSAHYLFCGLAAILWLGLGITFAFNSHAASRDETLLVTQLKRFATQLSMSHARSGDVAFQDLLIGFATEHHVTSCAVVEDKRYLAHSNPHNLGRAHVENTGSKNTVLDVTRVRYVTPDSKLACQYVLPITSSNGKSIQLVADVPEPRLYSQLLASGKYVPLAFLVPLIFIGIGFFLLRKTVRPLSQIDAQLRAAAKLPSLIDFHPLPVPISGGAALGWNRMVSDRFSSTLEREPGGGLAAAVSRHQDSRFQDALNSLSEGIATTDNEGAISFANDAMIALLDRRASDSLVGIRFEEALRRRWEFPDDRFLQDLDARQRTTSTEITHCDPAVERTLRLSRNPIQNDQGIVAGHVWSVRDISQQKLADRMREQFLDTATHELRTPLTNIKAYSETLALAEITDVENQKEFLNLINAEATRLARFVDDFLSLSSIEAGSLTVQKKKTDVRRMLQDIINKITPQLHQKEIELETSLPEKLPELSLDKDKMSATLLNLLGNAAKYTDKGGRIGFRVRMADQQLQIDVEDSGIGISEQELPKVFDKFFRSADDRVQNQTGTGLGLSLAREVVRLQGGELTAKSELNKGSVFTVTLPVT